MIGSLKTQLDKKLEGLLKSYGYGLKGDRLIRYGKRGYVADYIYPYSFCSYYSAAEYLISIISDDDYYNKFKQITDTKD